MAYQITPFAVILTDLQTYFQRWALVAKESS